MAIGSAENGLRNEAAVAFDGPRLRITPPLANGNYLMDPDVPTSGRIPLTALGGKQLIWQSESLGCGEVGGHEYADAIEGEHRIVVTAAQTARRAEIRISVRTL